MGPRDRRGPGRLTPRLLPGGFRAVEDPVQGNIASQAARLHGADPKKPASAALTADDTTKGGSVGLVLGMAETLQNPGPFGQAAQ